MWDDIHTEGWTYVLSKEQTFGKGSAAYEAPSNTLAP